MGMTARIKGKRPGQIMAPKGQGGWKKGRAKSEKNTTSRGEIQIFQGGPGP